MVLFMLVYLVFCYLFDLFVVLLIVHCSIILFLGKQNDICRMLGVEVEIEFKSSESR